MTEVAPVSPPTASVLSSNPDSTVVTFYSYKGGVGRSMAAANAAWLLASEYGKSVIVVDWDLEAPGLHRFFGIEDKEVAPGLIDYLTSYRDALSQPDRKFSESDVLIDEYLSNVDSFLNGGSIRLMSAGTQRDRASYVKKVRGFDWKGFYDNWGGAQLIEAMRTQFRKKAEFTLLDSRTGVTDIGGICTVQLPDIVVFVYVFNWQNMTGVETVASELHDTKNKTLQALKRWPTLHFLMSRKEFSVPEKLREWEARAEKMFGRFCDSPTIEAKYGKRVIDYLRDLSIPYVTYFVFGEELAAKTDLGLDISKALQPLIELLLQEKAESAAAIAAKRAGETRSFLKMRLGAVAAIVGFAGLAAITAGLYAYWKGYPLAKMFAVVVGDSPLPQLAATLLIGALCGAGGALVVHTSSDDARELEPRRFWSYAAARALAGALIGVTCAAFFQTSHFFPLISFFASAAVLPFGEGFRQGFLESSRSKRSGR